MQLNLASKFFHNSVLIFGVSIVIVALAWVGYQYISRPNPAFGILDKPQIQNLLEGKTQWFIGGIGSSFPRKAPVFEVTKRGFSAAQASSLAKNLGVFSNPSASCTLETCPAGGNLLTWQPSGISLTIDRVGGKIAFKNTNLLKSSAGSTLESEALLTKASAFLDKNGWDNSSLIFNSRDVNYFTNKGDFLVPAKDLASAQVVEFNYTRSVNGWEVVNSDGSAFISLQLMKRGGEVFALLASNTEIEANNDVTYPLLNTSEVKNYLKEGKGILARFVSDNYGSAQLGNADSIVVGKGRVALLDDGKGDFVEPIFIFQAVAAKSNNQSQAEVYLPAIKADYLN